jgi:hypothetical protein
MGAAFADPGHWPPPPLHRFREIGPGGIAALDHLPDDLVEQLADAADDGVPVVASVDGALPVVFAFVASETGSLWDVSIDTIPGHRRRGYPVAAALLLKRVMRERGKTAVWGALDGHPASASLARRLGFVENGRLWVLTRDDQEVRRAVDDQVPAPAVERVERFRVLEPRQHDPLPLAASRAWTTPPSPSQTISAPSSANATRPNCSTPMGLEPRLSAASASLVDTEIHVSCRMRQVRWVRRRRCRRPSGVPMTDRAAPRVLRVRGGSLGPRESSP